MRETIEVKVDGAEVRKHIGFVFMDEGRRMRMRGETEVALELETIGRRLIEDSREEEEESVRIFKDTLFDVE